MIKILIDNHKVLSIVQSPLDGTLFQFSTSQKKGQKIRKTKEAWPFWFGKNGPHEIEPIFQVTLALGLILINNLIRCL